MKKAQALRADGCRMDLLHKDKVRKSQVQSGVEPDTDAEVGKAGQARVLVEDAWLLGPIVVRVMEAVDCLHDLYYLATTLGCSE